MDRGKSSSRSIPCRLSVRETPQGGSRTITGTAIVFNVESLPIYDGGTRFREVVLPSACTMSFLRSQDIKLNVMHDRATTLARWSKGTGSLRITVDARGVNFEFEAPKCDLGDRCLEMVRRGDYSGCSFEFRPGEYDVDERAGEVTVRHRKFEAITALTIAMDPAYPQTTVSAR